MFTLPTLNLIPIKQLFHIFCKSNWNMNEVGGGEKMKQERLYRLPRTIHWIVALPGCFLIRCLNTAIAPNNLLIILTTPFNYKNSNKHSPQLANLGHTIRRHCSPFCLWEHEARTQIKTLLLTTYTAQNHSQERRRLDWFWQPPCGPLNLYQSTWPTPLFFSLANVMSLSTIQCRWPPWACPATETIKQWKFDSISM